MAETFSSPIAGPAQATAPAPAGGSGVAVADGGGSYTSTVSLPQANFAPAAETLVKSFVDAFKDRREQRLEQLRAPPGGEETATICWGVAPALDKSVTNPTHAISVVNRKPDEPPRADEDDGIRLRERQRYVEKIKVTSENNKSVFVKVERMRAWIADGSDGKKYLLEFNPKGQKVVLKEGEELPGIQL